MTTSQWLSQSRDSGVPGTCQTFPTPGQTKPTFRLRPLLFSIAYRMTGSVSDAEDLVQETYNSGPGDAELQGTEIESRRAYACAVVSRLAIDHLRSARVRREEYVGEWLPEPIVTDRSADPEQQAELSDSLSMAFLVLLERLTPSSGPSYFSVMSSATASTKWPSSSTNPRRRVVSWRCGPGRRSRMASLDSRPRSRSGGH